MIGRLRAIVVRFHAGTQQITVKKMTEIKSIDLPECEWYKKPIPSGDTTISIQVRSGGFENPPHQFEFDADEDVEFFHEECYEEFSKSAEKGKKELEFLYRIYYAERHALDVDSSKSIFEVIDHEIKFIEFLHDQYTQIITDDQIWAEFEVLRREYTSPNVTSQILEPFDIFADKIQDILVPGFLKPVYD
jgi:hypothetical protein